MEKIFFSFSLLKEQKLVKQLSSLYACSSFAIQKKSTHILRKPFFFWQAVVFIEETRVNVSLFLQKWNEISKNTRRSNSNKRSLVFGEHKSKNSSNFFLKKEREGLKWP